MRQLEFGRSSSSSSFQCLSVIRESQETYEIDFTEPEHHNLDVITMTRGTICPSLIPPRASTKGTGFPELERISCCAYTCEPFADDDVVMETDVVEELLREFRHGSELYRRTIGRGFCRLYEELFRLLRGRVMRRHT